MARWGAYGHPFGAWGNAGRGAESTLAERFAQGDIDEKEYRARLEVLRASNGPTGPAR
jgi:putative membrane protein